MNAFVQPQAPRVTWGNHSFDVHPPGANWSATASGIYIMAGKNREGRWVALYIGQASPFRQRLSGHEMWAPAQKAGATHIHAMAVAAQADRDRIERQLIQMYDPRLNTQLRR